MLEWVLQLGNYNIPNKTVRLIVITVLFFLIDSFDYLNGDVIIFSFRIKINFKLKVSNNILKMKKFT